MMRSPGEWPAATRIETRRLILEALRVAHAEEMLFVLGDGALHQYTGGAPPTLKELRERYASQVRGRSPDRTQGWLNWVVRERGHLTAVGTVQATLVREEDDMVAEVAWVIGVPHQRRGYATEAATAMVAWLSRHGVMTVAAHIHPKHAASLAVATRLGLSATRTVIDGETRWTHIKAREYDAPAGQSGSQGSILIHMSTRDPDVTPIEPPVIDRVALDRLAAGTSPLTAEQCMQRAQAAGALVDASNIDRSGPGDALLLWRNDSSEAWLNLWWQPRDTGYHDHDGSCVGVSVIEGRARNEPLVVGQPRRVREYRAGDSFAFPGSGIHRMEHDPGAITIHVYSPPLGAVGHYEPKDGELRREACPSDEPSGPSPGLLSAMTAGSSDPNE